MAPYWEKGVLYTQELTLLGIVELCYSFMLLFVCEDNMKSV